MFKIKSLFKPKDIISEIEKVTYEKTSEEGLDPEVLDKVYAVIENEQVFKQEIQGLKSTTEKVMSG